MTGKGFTNHRLEGTTKVAKGARYWLGILALAGALGFLWAEGGSALAQGDVSEEKPGVSASGGKSLEELYAQWGKVVAELQAARAASPPDTQRIAALVAELQRIRQRIMAEQAQTTGWRGSWGGPAGWCPWGLGPGGGLGLGLGRGRGPGAGLPQGRGQGRGRGWRAAGGGPPWARGW
jgi:hypothetical protein